MTHKAEPLPKLVFLEAGEHEPYTTDKIIAESAQVKRKVVSDLIRRYKTDLESFGVLRFKNAKPTPGSDGGRPEKLYHLNEQQATLLITYLRNTEPVKAFKKALVKEFYAMRAELTKRRELRAEGKPQRRSLTDMIRDNPEANRWDYKLYTDLAYKAAFGKTAAQIRKERAPGSKRRAVDLLTADELSAYQKQENAVASLYAVGVDYEAMKAVLLTERTK
ncbi:Rha family transcriptional regulator [Hominenteromicrobium sp.]|uniref:Rha family transcriptional regulator n=1 Tax=Hominenteromicrobium sp. TaxID=3073581 RepID=UPI003AABE1FF